MCERAHAHTHTHSGARAHTHTHTWEWKHSPMIQDLDFAAGTRTCQRLYRIHSFLSGRIHFSTISEHQLQPFFHIHCCRLEAQHVLWNTAPLTALPLPGCRLQVWPEAVNTAQHPAPAETSQLSLEERKKALFFFCLKLQAEVKMSFKDERVNSLVQPESQSADGPVGLERKTEMCTQKIIRSMTAGVLVDCTWR